MASNYLKDWRRKQSRPGAFLENFDSDEDLPQENLEPQDLGRTQEEVGASHDLVDTQEEGGTCLDFGDTREEDGSNQSGQLLDETFESSSFGASMGDEPYRQEDYGYRDYSDTSDEDTELVDLEARTEEGQSSLREDLASWATETKQTHSSVNKMIAILRKHGHNLPKDVRTLLQTPRFVDSIRKCDEFQKVVVETLMAILDELKSLNSRGEIEAESGQLPVKTLETFDMMSREIEEKQDVQRSMMTCDHQLMVSSVEARWPRSVHDSRIFRESLLGHQFEQGLFDACGGDKGYPCTRYLMTPYPDPETPSQSRFNAALSKCRVRIEMTSGVIKSRFNCLRGLRVSPERACETIVACVVLHNIAVIRKERAPHVPLVAPDIVDPITLDHPSGAAIRQAITDQFFT